MKITKLKFKNINYPIIVGSNAISLLKQQIKIKCSNAKKVGVVFDKKVPKKFQKIIKAQLKNYKVFTFEYQANEKLKSFNKVNDLVEKLIKSNFNRNDVLISVGGGIVGDFSGFVASIVKRGINFINLPSTLLAQVDASIGGKTGVNSINGKNLIGSFYQPKLVIIELKFLQSLLKRDIVCGFAEILKHSFIHDKKFFHWLKKNSKKILQKLDYKTLREAIIKSCKIKLFFVSSDEKEKNNRMILNFGHTFAHGIEAAKNFSRKINHGEAVLIGMHLATKLSYQKKVCSLKTFKEIDKFYRNNNLPYNLKEYFSLKESKKIVSFMSSDKKNVDDRINLILIKKIGRTTKPGKFKIKIREMEKILIKLINFNF